MRPSLTARFRLGVLFLGLAAAAADLAAQPPIAITEVNIVDVATGAILPRRTVLIDEGRITTIDIGTTPPSGATVLDGTDRYLIPGLWDMHVHLRHPMGPQFMKLLLANGVIGVRDMGSDCDGGGPVCLAEMRAWQAQVEGGEMRGPRLLGLSTFAVNPPWDFQATEERTRELVRQFAAKRIDWIKIYFRLSPEAFGWLMDEAQQQGLAVGGHIPLRVTSRNASAAGLRSLEHARDFLFDCFPGSAQFRSTALSQNPSMETMRAMVDDHDPAVCDGIFRTFVENGTWYVPTHVTRRMDAFADDSAFRADPRRRYIPGAVWEDWQEDADRMVALDASAEGRRVMRGFYERGLEITGRAHDAGVAIALGTDAGDTYVFPGFAVHDELGELVKAGLTPAEALAAATIRSAEFLGLAADHGTVETGKVADLVLLSANPLEDIADTRAVEMVIFRGEVLDRAALDGLLREVEEEVKAAGGG